MRFILRRLWFYVVAAFVAITINFIIPRLMPGNPLEAYLGKNQGSAVLTHSALCAIAEQLNTTYQHCGHKQPGIFVQYWDYLVNLAHLNLGVSATYDTTVAHEIALTLPWTAALVGFSTILAFALGTLIGIVAAWRRGGATDGSLPALSFFQGIPYFFLALLLQEIFTVHWHFLPSTGGDSTSVVVGMNWPFIASALEHSILPAATLVLASMAGWSVGMRNVMLTTISEEYVLAAQAKGLSTRRVVWTYAARNAILPNIAGFANALGLAVSGVLIMELVFSYPGIGNTLYQAVTGEDYPLLQGIFLVISLSVLAANFIADGVYVILDPRTRRRAAD
ncbi:MAG: ABC transporter permease [Firmicutes bacterium]|nr:ABC transporter permease [Bacillota bacterium]